jgi:hypothetical protein
VCQGSVIRVGKTQGFSLGVFWGRARGGRRKGGGVVVIKPHTHWTLSLSLSPHKASRVFISFEKCPGNLSWIIKKLRRRRIFSLAFESPEKTEQNSLRLLFVSFSPSVKPARWQSGILGSKARASRDCRVRKTRAESMLQKLFANFFYHWNAQTPLKQLHTHFFFCFGQPDASARGQLKAIERFYSLDVLAARLNFF